jgi:putative transposase
MPETDRLTQSSEAFELAFVEKEETPKPLMKLSIHLHAAGLSLSDTVSVLDSFGVDRVRSTVHNWVRKADLEPAGGKSPDHVAVDESVIQFNGERFWLYAAVDPATNEFLHVGLYNRCVMAFSEHFIAELLEKHDLDDAVFLVDGAPWLHGALHRHGCDWRHETHGRRNAVERVFKEVKRRTCQFGNHFRNASVDSAESWLKTFAFAWNQLI